MSYRTESSALNITGHFAPGHIAAGHIAVRDSFSSWSRLRHSARKASDRKAQQEAGNERVLPAKSLH
jgi:hypothetical protein